LEHGIILPDSSVRTWSGERFWNEKWNQDIDFSGAFRESCVWYFREVINEIGQERMKEELERLEYGNKDISDWQGQQNTNNKNPALTGFWIESSLLISPKEQTEVLERIFGADSVYSKEIQDELKQVMAVQGQDNPTVYGKTGMGKAHGVVVDAWFAGFAETEKGNLYFCVYLGENKEGNVSGTAAKEIAVEILRQTVQ
jgi:bla regulator protein BlaR1